MRSALLAVGLSVAAAGCYNTIPTQLHSVSAGKGVVVTLTSQGTARLAPAIGDFATKLEGAVTEADSTQITLALAGVTRRGDLHPTQFQGRTVSINAGDIDQIFTREISRRRSTAAFVALGVAGASVVYVIAKAVGILESSGTGKRTPPTP